MPATTKKYSRLACVALAIMAASILSGCGDDEAASREPLTLRPAPTEPGTPIDLDRARDSSGAVAFDRWPRACELLTDDEIKAVLPQTTKVERESENEEVRIKEGVVASGRYASVREATAKDGKCSFKLDLPATGLRLSDVNPPSFDVSIDLAGTPAFVKQNFPYADKPVAVAGGRCFRGDSASCVKGPVAFRIFSQFAHQEKDFADPDLEWRDRYPVNGEIVTISSPGGDSPAADEAFARHQQLRFDHIYVELAKIILRKI
ncbi:MAG: hypothetical protein H0W96_06770 [Solirubrobacterales bacterium]|nr:hypothetical protein [Solirubrobacterales bacterium]